MGWPTRAQVQAIYVKVNHTDLNAKVDQGIVWGKNRVTAALSRLYDVSAWLTYGSYLAATVSAAAFDNSYNDTAGGFPGLCVGDSITVSGFSTASGNNGTRIVVSATASKIVVSGLTALVNEGPGAAYSDIGEAVSGPNSYIATDVDGHDQFSLTWAPGQHLLVSGFSIASNNGVKVISDDSALPDAITVVEALTDEVAASVSMVAPYIGFVTQPLVPPALFDLVLRYAYAYASGEAVHSGQRLTASDDLAVRIIEACDRDLERYVSGEWSLVGDSCSGEDPGTVVTPRRYTGFVHLRTARPVLTMAPVEDQVLELVEEGEAFQ